MIKNVESKSASAHDLAIRTTGVIANTAEQSATILRLLNPDKSVKTWGQPFISGKFSVRKVGITQFAVPLFEDPILLTEYDGIEVNDVGSFRIKTPVSRRSLRRLSTDTVNIAYYNPHHLPLESGKEQVLIDSAGEVTYRGQSVNERYISPDEPKRNLFYDVSRSHEGLLIANFAADVVNKIARQASGFEVNTQALLEMQKEVEVFVEDNLPMRWLPLLPQHPELKPINFPE